MIRCLATFLTLVLLALPGCADERLVDIEAIDNAVGRLDETFEQQDADTIRSLVTEDHIAVVPYGSSPETVEMAVASLSKLRLMQTDLSEPTVVMLGPNSAMRTLTAQFKGSFDGKPFNYKGYVTSIMRKVDGKWLESFYQVTELGN